MIRFIPFSIALQAFCLYHAYKNNTQQKWFWLIIILPFLGSGIYLYYHFFNRATIEAVSDNLVKVVNTNYKIDSLLKANKFSSTVANKTALANEYVNIGEYKEAISLYQSCLNGSHSGDPDLIKKMTKAYFFLKDYEATIKYAEQIIDDPIFKKSDERIHYAWSLIKTNQKDQAEVIFQSLDHPFSNYYQRIEYCHFLIEEERIDEAKEKLGDMMDEINNMDRIEKRDKRNYYREIKSLYKHC